jgi:hypothetical protein
MMKFPHCVKLYYNARKLQDYWESNRSLEEAILIHLQSILNKSEEMRLNKSQPNHIKRFKTRTSESKAPIIVLFNPQNDFWILFPSQLKFINMQKFSQHLIFKW